MFNKFGVAVKASYTELTEKVTWPTLSELTNSAVVVMIASFIIAMVVWLIDISFENILKFIYDNIRHLIY